MITTPWNLRRVLWLTQDIGKRFCSQHMDFCTNSLDIHPILTAKRSLSRCKEQRFKTPVYLLRDIAGGDAVPLGYLRDAMSVMAKAPDTANIAEYEYQIKMFCAISKSSIRDEVQHILEKREMEDILKSCDNYMGYINGLVQGYRSLEQIIDVPTAGPELRAHFSFGDEFLSYMSVYYSFKLIKLLEGDPAAERQSAALKDFVRDTGYYRSRKGFPAVSADNRKNNDRLIYRYGVLRKYVASDLFIELEKKKDGVAVSSCIIPLLRSGNDICYNCYRHFSEKFRIVSHSPFLALIVSYMLKIGQSLRVTILPINCKNILTIRRSLIKDQKVGHIKEGVDFVSASRIPQRC